MQLRRLWTAAAGLALMATSAMADWAPEKPINFYMSFGAGSPVDTIGRALASEMEKQTGWQVIAENRAGGGGIALASQLARGATDGTEVGFMVNMPILINLVRKGEALPFDLDSFAYLGSAVTAEKAIIARADAPFDTIPELIDYAKENGLVMGAAPGPELFVFQALNKAADGKIRKLATDGSQTALTMLLGEQSQVGFGGGGHLQYLENGDMKVLASINGERLTYAPDKPTLVEEGIDLSIDPFFYMIAPGGTDPEAQEALTAALDEALHSDTVMSVVERVIKRTPVNYGAEGTYEALEAGLAGVQKIFGK